MALDYKTMQTLASSQPADATSYCPECGRPWGDLLFGYPGPSTVFPWRVALLGILGLFLTITFGQRVVGLVEAGSPVCATTLVTPNGPVCFAPSNPTSGDWITLGASLRQSTTAEGEIGRDLLATAGGVATMLVGIGALIRPRLRARSSHGTSLVPTAWAVGETLWVVVSIQVLALYADLVIVRLSLGWPTAWWVALDSITDQVSALFDFVTAF
jgi:hypothetical protein